MTETTKNEQANDPNRLTASIVGCKTRLDAAFMRFAVLVDGETAFSLSDLAGLSDQRQSWK